MLGWCLTRAMVLLSQALPYVALLIVMLFFIYAVIGMQVRGTGVGFGLERDPGLEQALNLIASGEMGQRGTRSSARHSLGLCT